VLLGAAGAAMTGFVSMDVVAELVNLGALTAFALVSVGVVVLRVLEPQRDRPFRVPLMPVVPILAVIGCIVLATALAWITWLWFGLWLLAGLIMYAVYGRRHSALASVLSRDSCRGGSEGT
jgi:APA family basic amino acid/polyamine antiporter